MIPKKIHLVWLSGEIMPKKYAENLDIIRSMNKDYEVIIWTYDDVKDFKCSFMHQAISEKKWAFATDYIRARVLRDHGGIYTDLDVVPIRPFSNIPEASFVVGWESAFMLGPHFLACEKEHTLAKILVGYYEQAQFIEKEEFLNCTPIPTLLTWICHERYQLVLNGEQQHLKDDVQILPVDFFTLNLGTGNEIADHLYDGGWLPNGETYRNQVAEFWEREQRPSRKILRKVVGIFPRSFQFKFYNFLNAKHAFPAAYEYAGYDAREFSRFRSIRLAQEVLHRLKGLENLRERSPLRTISHHHLQRRQSSNAPSNREILKIKSSAIVGDEKVSIVVPIYGVKNYLRQCLRSIQRQTHKNIDVILVDDGSIDGSREIAESFAASDNRFHYFRKENGGLGSARNYGLTKVKADWLSFIDADDYIHPRYIESLLDVAHFGNDLVISDFDHVTSDGRFIERKQLSQYWENTSAAKQALLSGSECYAWNKLYRTSHFSRAGYLFGDGWFEDISVVPAIIMSAHSIGYTGHAYYNYVQRADSLVKISAKDLYKNFDIFKNYKLLDEKKRDLNPDLWEEYYEWMMPRHLFLFRMAALRQEPLHERRVQLVREFSEQLNATVPGWSETAFIRQWLNEPRRQIHRFARRTLVEAYKTGEPRFYSRLESLNRYGF